MKVTVAVLACMALIGLTGGNVQGNVVSAPVDKQLLELQKFIFEIFYRIQNPLQFEEWIKYGEKLILDKTKYTNYTPQMVEFQDLYKMGAILPQNEFFSVFQKLHLSQGLGLFQFFYNAKDFETFMRNVAWARININEGMFVFALTLAVIHRSDMQGLVLPPIYEIMPQMFFNSKFILQAEKFNVDVFNRQIMLEKEFKYNYQDKYASSVFKDRFFLKDWKVWQWWKLMGLEEDWHLENMCMLRNNYKVYQNDPKFKAIWGDIKAYWMPVDYTRDVHMFNQESQLSYFTEDVGLNAYWYYTNMYHPGFLKGSEYNSNDDRRGELLIYSMNQLLARYYSERLSVGLGSIPEFCLYGVIQHGYDPQLIAYNGNGFSFRKNYYEMVSHENIKVYNAFVASLRRIEDVIDSGKYVTRDAKVIDLTSPDSVEIIAELLQGHVDIVDKQFFGYWYPFAALYFSGANFDSLSVVPHVLLNFETMLRDPFYYVLVKKIVDFFDKFLSHLPPYTPKQVQMNNLTICDGEISPLKTYFDFVDVDASTLLNDKMIFHDGKFYWDKTLLARQLRLNHEPFFYKLKVKSEVAQNVIVNVFLTPVINELGEHIDLFTHTENFIRIDKFVYGLTVGENVIERNSNEFGYTANDYSTYTELYKYVMLAYEGKQEYLAGFTQRYGGFPNRLILPRGWVSGMPMKVIFFIAPYTGKEGDTVGVIRNYYGYPGGQVIDNLPFGYPFDRRIENIYQFFGPNLLVKDAKIFFTQKYEKYYPNKYENFGHFNYDL